VLDPHHQPGIFIRAVAGCVWRATINISFGERDLGKSAVPLSRFSRDATFAPGEIAVMNRAFEGTLGALGLVDRTDPAAEMVAKNIIELAKQGERDPVRLCDRAVEALSGKPPSAA
jgi:hypothetical protein